MSNFDQIQMIQNSQISDPNRTTLHPLQPRDFMYRHRNMPLLANSFLSNKNPRKESFLDMVQSSCCPNFHFFSISFFKIVADIALYVTGLLLSGLSANGELLAVHQKALFPFGEKYAYFIRYEYQVYRLITSLFLNANFVQLVANIIGMMIFGSYVEQLLRVRKYAIACLLTGVGGVLFGILFHDEPSVDSTTLTTGLIGVQLGNVMISWGLWDYPGSGRYQMLSILIFGVCINFLIGSLYESTDWISQIGGLMIGLLVSLAMIRDNPVKRGKSEKRAKIFCYLIIFGYLVVGLFVFFLNRKPKMIATYTARDDEDQNGI